jgi:hypothetical protein
MKPAQTGSRWRRNLWIGAGLLAAYTVAGFFVAPAIVKAQLEKRATAALGRTVTVGKVRVNPFAISLTLENFDVRLKEGTGSFLGWSRLYLNADPLASLLGTWTVGAVELDGFHAAAILQRDGTFNFADIVARLGAEAVPATPAAEPAQPPAVHIGRLAVTQARLDFTDESRARPFATTLGPVSFSLTDFRTAVERGAPYRFEAVTEAGERLAWSGALSAVPLASTGELRLENIQLPKYAAYYADLVQAELTDGKLSVGGRYEARFDGANRVLKLAGAGLQLRDLKVVTRAGQQPLLDLPALEVAGVNADALALKADVAAVTLTGGHVSVAREQDGSINLLKALLPAPADERVSNASSGKAAAPLPDVRIGEVAVKGLTVDVADHTVPGSARLGLADIQVALKNVTLADGAEMPLDLAFNWAPAGTVKVTGTVAIQPEVRATLQTDVAGLALLPLSPYVEQFVRAHLTQGAVSTSGAVTLALGTGTPVATFDGRVGVDQLGLVDATQNESLAGFASLALNGLKVTTAPQLTVTLDEVNVAAPYARVLVGQDGTVNLTTLAKAEAVAGSGGVSPPSDATATEKSGDKLPPTSETPANAAVSPRIAIARVVVSDGEFSFADRSLQPGVRMAITRFGGTIAGLSSENLARADVDLKATVDGVGPVAIQGQLDPLGAKKFVNLKVDFRNVDLLPLSPYSGKYAGYELARGQLNLDVQAKLDDRRIEATNVITLNQFTFGAPVESPDATKLPVRLGVALLKDMDGRIVIDVPMAGSLDDPELRIGKVVLRVIVNLLTKAAVSPFALLGSMFGGGGDELAFQEFAPGGSELLPAEAGKLATMVKALANRPGLSLGIEGGFDGPADTHALREQKLAALVRSRIWEERRAADPNLPPPDQLVITPEEHATMVKRLFDEKFPPGTEFGAPLPPPPAVAAAPTPAKRSLFRRVVEVFTGEGASAAAAPAEVGPPAPDAAAGPSLAEMSGRLAGTLDVSDDDLRALADARARRVRDYFIGEGKIAPDRLFLTQAKEPKQNKGPRVFLTLQ